MGFDAEGDPAPTSAATKRLIVLACDVLLGELSLAGREPQALAAELVGAGLLPACYEQRYDRGFLEGLVHTLELTRNALVCELPHLANTLAELAAWGIRGQARRILSDGGRGWEAPAARVHPALPATLRSGQALEHELGALESLVLEDADVLMLFELAPGEDPRHGLLGPDPADDWTLLRFENWLVPFGHIPRPQIGDDGQITGC